MKIRCRPALYLALAGVFAGLGAGSATPALAQGKPAVVVKATDARGVLNVLEQAGYDAKLNPREGEDDASIEITTSDGGSYIQFSDCQEAVPDFCETLVLSTSWDRTTPISDTAIAEANLKFKYVSVFRDANGDPVMQWAILTRDTGLTPTLFLNALQRYLDVVRDFDAVAFEGDEATETPADAPPTT